MPASEDLHVAFARFEGTVTNELKNLVHDVKNLSTKLEAYATTRDLDATTERVEKIEKNVTWIARTVVGSVLMAVLGAVVTLGPKVLH